MNTKKPKASIKNKKPQSHIAFIFLSSLSAAVLVFLILISMLACQVKYSAKRLHQKNFLDFHRLYQAQIRSLQEELEGLEKRLNAIENDRPGYPIQPPPTGTPEIVQ